MEEPRKQDTPDLKPIAPPMWKQYPGVTLQIIISAWVGLLGIDFNPSGPQIKIRIMFVTIILSACNTETMGYAALMGMAKNLQKLQSEFDRLCIMRGVKQQKTSRAGIILEP